MLVLSDAAESRLRSEFAFLSERRDLAALRVEATEATGRLRITNEVVESIPGKIRVEKISNLQNSLLFLFATEALRRGFVSKRSATDRSISPKAALAEIGEVVNRVKENSLTTAAGRNSLAQRLSRALKFDFADEIPSKWNLYEQYLAAVDKQAGRLMATLTASPKDRAKAITAFRTMLGTEIMNLDFHRIENDLHLQAVALRDAKALFASSSRAQQAVEAREQALTALVGDPDFETLRARARTVDPGTVNLVAFEAALKGARAAVLGDIDPAGAEITGAVGDGVGLTLGLSLPEPASLAAAGD